MMPCGSRLEREVACGLRREVRRHEGREAHLRCTWEERPQYEGHAFKGAHRLVKPKR